MDWTAHPTRPGAFLSADGRYEATLSPDQAFITSDFDAPPLTPQDWADLRATALARPPLRWADLVADPSPEVLAHIQADMTAIHAAGETPNAQARTWWAWSVGDARITPLCAAWGLRLFPTPGRMCADPSLGAEDPKAATRAILARMGTRMGQIPA